MPQGQSWAPAPSTGVRWTWEASRAGPVNRSSRSGAGRLVVGWAGRDVAGPP